MSRIFVTFVFLMLLPCFALAQAPTAVISSGGIVNGASFRPAGAPDSSVAPGSIISIFGSNLASGTAGAAAVPLPTDLLGTRVRINGIQAPLFFVSPTQINAQVPREIPPGTGSVIVERLPGGTSSAPVSVVVTATAPGIFTVTSNGTGPGAIQNFVAPGNTPLNTFNRAIAPGGVIIVYFTGGGAVENPPATGAAGNGQRMVNQLRATIGGRPATVEFAGLAPGFVGLYQANIRVPSDLPSGCFMPIQLSTNPFSNFATLAVAPGGNCNTATSGGISTGPGTRMGFASLNRTATDFGGLPLPPQPPSNTFSATFMAFDPQGLGFSSSEGAIPATGCTAMVTVPTTGGPVQTPGVRFLDAGTLTLGMPNPPTPRTVARSQIGIYSQDLGTNAITPGTYTLSGSGGADVGAFGPVSLTLASLFNVTSYGFSGSNFSQAQLLTATWTCPSGSENGQVLAFVSSSNTERNLSGSIICVARCGDRTLTIISDLLRQIPTSSANAAAIGLFFTPDLATAPRITATGLDFGHFTYSEGTFRVGATLNP